MSENYDFLKNPFDGLSKKDVNEIQNKCTNIAENLFFNYGIKCGNKTFRLAEIEFYYYKKEDSDINNFDAPWNKETYQRSKDAGKLFFHYSGIDICFQCHFDEKEKDNENGEFGGILIRSLIYEDNEGIKILAGPSFCANAMLNACDEYMPRLVSVEHQHCIYDKTIRCGIHSDEKQENGILLLCYYVTHINNTELKWEKASERISWDKKKRKFKKETRNYKLEIIKRKEKTIVTTQIKIDS